MKSVMNSLHLVAISNIIIRVILPTILREMVQNEQWPGLFLAAVKPGALGSC